MRPLTEHATAQTGLNRNHHRVLWATFTHLDTLLRDIEAATRAEESASSFAKVRPDLTPTQQRVLLGYVRGIRERLTNAVNELGLEPGGAPIAASWSAQTTLHFVLIALEELNASRLDGYGALGAAAAERLGRLSAECQRMVRLGSAYLVQGLGRDLAGRLAELERAPVDLELLRTVERIVTTHGLVELRGALQSLIEQLELGSFEIGIFGRVGSGKSSLLNAVLAQDVLPVGVTPVTAVPTRITWGATPRAEIRFAEAPPLEIPLERLPEFVSEEGNPANRRQVTRALVELPSPRLREDVVFVDTPGLGSLAAVGARESYAYLPRCDLGILLLDSGGSPSPEDLDLLRLLYDSGIPAMVVLSKADLLPPADRDRLRHYVSDAMRTGLGVDPALHFVSTVGPGAGLVQQWFASEIEPLLSRTRELREASAARKLAHLRGAVEAALRLELRRGSDAGSGSDAGVEPRDDSAATAASILDACEKRCRRLTDEFSRSGPEIVELVSRVAGDAAASGPPAVRQAVRATLLGRIQAGRGDARLALLACRDELRKLLGELALKGPGESPIDLQADLLLLPEIELPPELERVTVPVAASGFVPQPVRSALVRLSVRRQLVVALPPVLSELASRLYRWSGTETSRLGERFSAQAEPLSLLRGRDLRLAADVQANPAALEADLQVLHSFESSVSNHAAAAAV
jgi:GTP-binding protein EngB required for normal cell division